MATINATLDAAALDQLEERLTILAQELFPPVVRGPGGAGGGTTVEGPTADSVVQDVMLTYQKGISVAPHAESRPLIPLFAAAGKTLPPELQVDHAKLNYDFYSVEVVFNIMLADDLHPADARFELRLSDNVTNPARKTRAIQLFPGRKDINLFTIDIEGGIGVDADMNLTLPMSDTGLPIPFGKVSADARLKAGFVMGPFSYPICRAAIEVIGEQSPAISWHYKMASVLAGANIFKSVLILKVAKEASDIALDATLSVTPYKASWLGLRTVLPPLRASARLVVEQAAQ